MTKILLPLLAASALAGVASAQEMYGDFTPPKNAFGQPDIQGIWTNETLTELQRPAEYEDRLVMTPAEVATLETQRMADMIAGDAPTDPSLTIEDLPFDCGGGFTGVNCGYNSGWTDSGDTIMRVAGQPRTSFITTTENGRVPARREGAPQPYNQYRILFQNPGMRREDNPESMSLAERCLTSFGYSAGPVMLPLLYNNNYEIVQGSDSVAILVEMVHDVRIVRIDDEHRTDGIRPWWGDSIGWYEGDTLVVETTNYPKENAFQGAWEDLTVTERFTRVDENRLHYAFTVESPAFWDKPWGGEYEFHNTVGGIYEYACHEGNYALEGILAGARAEESEEAAALAD